MFIDALDLVSDAQAFTGAATASTNSIDLNNPTPKRQVGTGEPIGFGVTIDVAAGTGSTHTFDVVQSDNADLSTPDVLGSVAFLAATLVAGFKFFMLVPPGKPTKRYIGIRNTATGGTTTVSATSWLTLASMFSVEPVAYKVNYTV